MLSGSFYGLPAAIKSNKSLTMSTNPLTNPRPCLHLLFFFISFSLSIFCTLYSYFFLGWKKSHRNETWMDKCNKNLSHFQRFDLAFAFFFCFSMYKRLRETLWLGRGVNFRFVLRHCLSKSPSNVYLYAYVYIFMYLRAIFFFSLVAQQNN